MPMAEDRVRYHFRDAGREDVPLLLEWLARPHITEWWGDDPDASLAEIRDAMAGVETTPLIVEMEGRPVAYLQSYDPHLEAGHPYQDQPVGTLGMDVSIGPAELLGKGHGSAIIRQYAEELFRRGARRIVIDPDPANRRAIRAYEKAGFRFLDRRTAIYGPAFFMALDAPQETDLT